MVRTGLDAWVADGFSALRGKVVGAIVNQTATDAEFRHFADLIAACHGVRLGALFGPEHGIRGQAAYMEAVQGGEIDSRTGARVFSLYGSTAESLTPQKDWLKGLDALVFDLQDVGSRYYTYGSTMGLAMKAAAECGLPFFILDRPNPIGGNQIEGNLVGEKFRSFVGQYPIPNRHGMTLGELALYLNATEKLGCDLSVVRCLGWRRDQYWEDTGLPFVPPSPNMPTPATALVYPGMCLLEGTNLSEGRGTCRPFEQFGAPWLSAEAVVERLRQFGLPGVQFRPVSYVPGFDKHSGHTCQGAMIHVVNRQSFQPLFTGLAVVKTAHDLAPGRFQWRTEAYEFATDVLAFDLLCGTDRVRLGIEQGWPLSRLVEDFDAQLATFRATSAPYMLYE